MKRLRKSSSQSTTPIHGSALFSSRRRRRYLIGGLLIAVFSVCLFVWSGLLDSNVGRTKANEERLTDAIQSAYQGRLHDAEPLLRKALERDPNNIDILRSLFIGLIGNHRLVEAESVLTQWCTLRPGDAEPFKFRMDLRHNRALQLKPGDEQEQQKHLALNDGKRVVLLEPNDWSTGKSVIVLCLASGRFSEADLLCRQFLKTHPEDAELQFLQARVCHSLDLTTEAKEFLDKLVATQPKFTSGLLLRAILYCEANEAEKAIPLLRTVDADGKGTHKEARYHLGLALARAGQNDEAKRILAQVQRDNFERDNFALDSLAVRTRRAELLINCGKIKEANDLLQAVLSMDRNCTTARQLLAICSNAVDSIKEVNQPVLPGNSNPSTASYEFQSRESQRTHDVLSKPEADSGNGPSFEDITQSSGIAFRHFDPSTPELNILETMGSGLGWIDYNNDGLQDLFCVQVGPLPSSPNESLRPTNKLYRNNGDKTFTDVSESAGLANVGFGMGCAVGDYDNDGFDDLLVSNWKGVILYHNESDSNDGRRFVDVTAKAGIDNPHWATSCGWGDIDGDGYLDLYVCNYAEVNMANYPRCEHSETKTIFSCPPSMFESVSHRLFRNNGNLSFSDVTETSGIAEASPAPGLGVVLADLDGDGKLDIYVANDMRPAYLFHNQGNGQFIEKALFSGCGLGSSGENIAGMGVDAADIDSSGRQSLFVTNFHFKQNILYRNAGGLLFDYWTHRSGLGRPSIGRLGFGAVFCDVDLDGRLDLAVANGHVERESAKIYGAPYAQNAQLFLGQGAGRFHDGSSSSGPYFRNPRVGRGLAWADFDNDGKPDLAFSHNAGPVALLHNNTNTTNFWLSLELIGDGKSSNRNAIGARVEIETANRKQTRFINGGGSYLSASDRRLLVGMGSAQKADRITVRWPSGNENVFDNVECNRRWRLRESDDSPEAIHPHRILSNK